MSGVHRFEDDPEDAWDADDPVWEKLAVMVRRIVALEQPEAHDYEARVASVRADLEALDLDLGNVMDDLLSRVMALP